MPSWLGGAVASAKRVAQAQRTLRQKSGFGCEPDVDGHAALQQWLLRRLGKQGGSQHVIARGWQTALAWEHARAFLVFGPDGWSDEHAVHCPRCLQHAICGALSDCVPSQYR